MSYPVKTTFTLDWTTLADVLTPGLYTAAQLKALFNARDQELLDFLNSILAVLTSVTAGASGAENIGSAAISGVAGATTYAQLVDLKAQINAAVTGAIPDRSLANTKLVLATLTGAEIANNTVSLDNIKVGVKNMITMGAMF